MAVSVYGIDRALWDHPDLAEEPYTQKQAWAWLIGAAAYQDKRIRTTRGPITLKRGEFWFSVRFLATKWLWSKSRVDRFLDMLVKRDMLRDDLRDNIQVYFVINYNKFQIVKAPKRDMLRDDLREASGTTSGQQRDKEKDLKDTEDNEKKIARSADADVREAVEDFNAIAAEMNWPKVQRLTKPRLSKLKQRLSEAGGVEGWRNAMARARASPFLRGDTRRNGTHEGWVPDFDFFLQQSSFLKLIEGKYDERTNSNQPVHANAELERLQRDAELERERLGFSAPN